MREPLLRACGQLRSKRRTSKRGSHFWGSPSVVGVTASWRRASAPRASRVRKYDLAIRIKRQIV